MTELLATLGTVAGIVAALIAGLRAKTTASPRIVAIGSVLLGPATAMLVHASGYLDFAGTVGGKAYLLAAAWGLVSSFAGAGITNANLLHAIAPPDGAAPTS
jgi:hypothetical protein